MPTRVIQDLFNDRWPRWSLTCTEVSSTLARMPEVERTNAKHIYPATWSLKEV